MSDTIFVADGGDLYTPTEHARGPWDPRALHGGAPAALIAAAFERMEHRIGMVAEPYSRGRGGGYVKAGKALAILGAGGAALSRRSPVATAVSGVALILASAATRWGIFHAGLASAADPKYTVVPQRQRLNERTLAASRALDAN